MGNLVWPLFAFLSLLMGVVFIAFFGPTQDETSFWTNFWTALNALSVLATLLVVAYYTYETYQLRRAAVFSNKISFRPILDFDSTRTHFGVLNKGRGPALNSCLITWIDKQLRVVPETDVPGVMPPSGGYWFNPATLIATDEDALKKMLPPAEKVIARITSKDHNLFCLVYADLEGTRYFSITNGSNGLLEQVFEHGLCEDV